MSCLAISELPLADQVAIELREASKLAARTSELFAFLDAPAEPGHPLRWAYTAGASTPVTNMEAAA